MNNVSRKSVSKLLVLQLVIGLSVAAVFLLIDTQAAFSGMLGTFVCVLPSSYFALRLFKYEGAREAKKILSSFYKGEAVKFVLTILLFAIVFKYVAINAVAFFITFIITQAVFWCAFWVL